MSRMVDRQALVRMLESESEVMPAKQRREFGRFLNRLDPPQRSLKLARGLR